MTPPPGASREIPVGLVSLEPTTVAPNRQVPDGEDHLIPGNCTVVHRRSQASLRVNAQG